MDFAKDFVSEHGSIASQTQLTTETAKLLHKLIRQALPMDLRQFISEASQWQIVRRSIVISTVVGTILIVINHGSCVLNGHFSTVCGVQCGLTFLVPYFVSTVSCVLAHADCQTLPENPKVSNDSDIQ